MHNDTPTTSDDISIVTAFFDIGRGDWTPDKGIPGFVHRTTETYLERFGTMASLDNEMVIYTSPDMVDRVWGYRKGKEDRTTVVPVPIASMYPERREAIRRVQSDPAFIAKINPNLRRNPEYWSVDYVLVTNLKSVFTAHAVQNNLVHCQQVAWMDFGYCRSPAALGGSTKWRYRFTPNKIHLFIFNSYHSGMPIEHIVANNIVFVCGAAVVGSRDLWPEFARLNNFAAEELLKMNLVDDDQTLWMMASLYKSDIIEIHKISDQDWHPVLRLFNTEAKSSP